MNKDSRMTEKEKKLKHVKVYDLLYEQIQNGIYFAGSQLPSEPDLAQQMGVSRMTLRQALALLQEDGLIKNIHGKGNFIREKEDNRFSGLELICHPVYQSCTETIDSMESEFRVEPPSDYITENLGFKTPVVVIADRWYKNKAAVLAYSLTFLPIETVSGQRIDLNQPEQLYNFLEHTIYEISQNSIIKCSYSTTGNFTAQKLMSEHNMFVMMHETLYTKGHQVLAVNKHYLPADTCHINIHAKRESKTNQG